MKRKQETEVIRHVKFIKSEAPPNEMLLERVRQRIASRKDQSVRTKDHDDNVATDRMNCDAADPKMTVEISDAHSPDRLRRAKFIEGLKKQALEQRSTGQLHENLKISDKKTANDEA